LPTGGRVLVGGRDTRRAGVLELSKLVGYVFQNPDHQIFADTVFDEVAFGPRNFGVPPGEITKRVEEALAAVGLSGYEQADPFALTKGERQRVAVASVLATQPRVIILDEPTTGLDYREQRGMMQLIKKLNEDGHTIIVVTHTMWVVAEYAHRVVVMKDGRIMFDGPTREVFCHEEELTEAFLRPPQIVRLGNRLGHPLLTVEEARACLTKGGQGGGRLPLP
ncbi:MAG: ATP-binding cassette domain-containing protein, partial [Bacillota bacterium]